MYRYGQGIELGQFWNLPGMGGDDPPTIPSTLPGTIPDIPSDWFPGDQPTPPTPPLPPGGVDPPPQLPPSFPPALPPAYPPPVDPVDPWAKKEEPTPWTAIAIIGAALIGATVVVFGK